MRNLNRKTIPGLLVLSGAIALMLASPEASPQSNKQFQQKIRSFGLDNRAYGNEEAEQQAETVAPEAAAKQAKADASFDSIMIMNATPPAASPAAPAQAYGRLGYGTRGIGKGGGGQGYAGDTTISLPPAPAEPPVVIPLKVFADLRDRLKKIHEEEAKRLAPAVVLGAAEYSGEAKQGALALTLKLQVTLGRPDKWKIVPLVGDGAVLAKATVDGQPIPVSSQAGYHVWVTQRTGEVTVNLDLLVPARGPRGSIEYDFLVARTPVTKFSCRFPLAGLEPKLDAAIQSTVTPAGGGTLLSAMLQPTTRIHLVGFREMGEAEGQKAKVYAESLNLLSVDEGTLDVFTVVRYTILYAGTKEFTILVPPNMTVVAADGEGAFRFVAENLENGTVIKGETAFPIRNNYEISLRLHRELTKGGETFDVPLPRCQGVEREYGWLGVEVPGKLKLVPEKAEQVLPVDVRQLPPEMVSSAVSPILLAYRYHSPAAHVRLVATRLPEKEAASGSVDRIRAVTQVSVEGNVQTEMRITLRNRLRHSLDLKLPAGQEVLSATLDGQPVKPSQDEEGQIVLPLKRSTGQERLRPFTLQVSLRGKVKALGWFGHPDLALPAVDLPVSSLVWNVFLPANNLYSTLKGDIEPQFHVGRGSWHQAPQHLGQAATVPALNPMQLEAGGAASTADTGAMPVRLNVEQSGVKLEYSRYWIESGHPVKVSCFFVRSWLRIPVWLALALLLGFCLLLLSTRFQPIPTRNAWWIGLVLGLIVLWPLHKAGGVLAILLGILFGIVGIGWQRGWLRKAPVAILEWGRTLWPRFKGRQGAPEAFSVPKLLWKIALAVVLVIFTVYLIGGVLKFLAVFLNLGGPFFGGGIGPMVAQ